ncbi:hypothetical protein LJC53_07655 [Bacteroidales bacterium OttesenSCG-928-C03]|nr:hypothetical protein [Bacteroidales bacterium OttesenSCG-928-C03]
MDDIKAWLSGERDWTAGIALLEKYHKNRFFVKNFRLSNPASHSGKLEYELKKLAGIPLADIFSGKTGGKPVSKEKPGNKEPRVITAAKDEVYKLHTQISIAHRHLYELGESNSEDVVKKRKKILDDRLPLIKRYEQIYLLKEEYFKTGAVPEELPALLTEEKGERKADKDVKKGDNQNKFAELSDIELFKKEHAIKVHIGKINNRLQYHRAPSTFIQLPNGNTINITSRS